MIFMISAQEETTLINIGYNLCFTHNFNEFQCMSQFVTVKNSFETNLFLNVSIEMFFFFFEPKVGH